MFFAHRKNRNTQKKSICPMFTVAAFLKNINHLPCISLLLPPFLPFPFIFLLLSSPLPPPLHPSLLLLPPLTRPSSPTFSSALISPNIHSSLSPPLLHLIFSLCFISPCPPFPLLSFFYFLSFSLSLALCFSSHPPLKIQSFVHYLHYKQG